MFQSKAIRHYIGRNFGAVGEEGGGGGGGGGGEIASPTIRYG